MKNNGYKILVLSDLNRTTSATLKSSVSLAQMIGAEIEIFHAKEFVDIVDRDNQLSAIRTLKDEHINIKKKIEALISPILKDYDIKINYNYSFGKIKEEIKNHIKNFNPDIVVLGQRNSSRLQVFGDSVTRYILKNFKGVIMISASETVLVPNEKIRLGVLNNSEKVIDTKYSKYLISHIETPLKLFKIGNSHKKIAQPTIENEDKIVEYVFEKSPEVMNTLSSYLLKNNINLLYVDRAKKKTKKIGETSLKEIVSKLNVSLLVSEV